jgi:farnesyl-diphosphate farnesyltransferase
MERWITEMGKGMVEFSARMGEGQGVLKTLSSMADLDRYCYYIAGTVGYLLTDLFFLHSSHIGQERFYELQADAEAFGLGLQKVNIVKDLADDVRRGWCFIPTDCLNAAAITPEAFANPDQVGAVYAAVRPVLADAADHLGCAWRYLTKVPLEEREIRLFLAYSLFFALRTLALVAENPGALVAPQKLKISRLEVAKIVARCQLNIGNPSALERAYAGEALGLQVFRD